MTTGTMLTAVIAEEVEEPEEMGSEEIRPENIPLPTDSMITVRLSDVQLPTHSAALQDPAQELNAAAVEQNSRTSVATSLTRTSSRASSSSSQDSSTSNSVDWEGLERTEEQELKDDATDEVSRYP